MMVTFEVEAHKRSRQHSAYSYQISFLVSADIKFGFLTNLRDAKPE
jgi:hypothetical protein